MGGRGPEPSVEREDTEVNWWDYVNPFTAVGNAAAQVVADGWTAGMLAVWNCGLWLLKLALSIEDEFLVPDLSDTGPMSGIYPYTFWIAGVLVVMLLMVQLGIAAVRRDGQSMARPLIGTGQFVLTWCAGVALAVATLAAAGGLTHALMQAMLHVDAMAAWQPWSAFSVADVGDATLATVLGILGLMLIFAAFSHLLIMLTRAAALVVLAATHPVAAAGLVWEGGRVWFWKTLRWFVAAAFTPVIMMLMLGAGVQITSRVAIAGADSLQKAVGTAVPSIFVILMSSFAPLALFKLLAFVDPGTSSGSAMRAGLSAQGGLSGLSGLGSRGGSRGDDGDSSNTASISDDNGVSDGEASTEASTSARFDGGTGNGIGAGAGGGVGVGGAGSGSGATPAGASGGGLMGAVGVLGKGIGLAASAGAKAAVIGADLTNQMGVGHNTYLPDFAGSRSRRQQQGQHGQQGDQDQQGQHQGGSDGCLQEDDNPQVNGAGGGTEATVGPPQGPAAGSGPGGSPGGVGGSPGGGEAGAVGGAAAVPVVPV